MTYLALLTRRGVIEITGEDRVAFLQGLVSNDVALAAPGRAIFAALLTPQGRWLADFFVFAEPARLLLDCDAGSVPLVLQKLTRFRLRAKVMLRDASAELAVHAAWGVAPDPAPDAIMAPDPRLAEAGWRILAAAPLPGITDDAAWDRHRLELGLPDTGDMEAEKSLLLETGFDELSGVSWTKGCYMGQELTARTKYRGLIKKRLVPVAVSGALPATGTPVMLAGREVGVMRTGRDGLGIVQLRIDALSASLTCGDAVLTPQPAKWMRLAEPVA